MAISYTILTGDKDTAGSLRYQVRHSILAADYVLDRAQEAVYSQLRVREMVTRKTATLATGASTIAFPAHMLEPLALYRAGSYRGIITMLDHDHFEQRLGEQENGNLYEGTPTECSFDSTAFYLNTKADIDYEYHLWYMGRPAYLSASVPTNDITDRYGYIIETMAMHYAWMDRQENDQKADNCLQRAMGYITKANEEYDMFRQQMRMEAFWSRD